MTPASTISRSIFAALAFTTLSFSGLGAVASHNAGNGEEGDETPVEIDNGFVGFSERVAPIDFRNTPKSKRELAKNLKYGGQAELGWRSNRDFDLASSMPDSLDLLQAQLSFALTYTPTKYIKAYVNTILSQDIIINNDGMENDAGTHIKLSRAYVSFRKYINGLTFVAGRQRVRADREWGYDSRLDGFRGIYERNKFTVDAAVGWKGVMVEEFINDERGKKSDNYLVRVAYELTRRATVAGYIIHHRERGSSYERPVFYGLHVDGEFHRKSNYWLELGAVHGCERKDGMNSNFSGFGADAGVTIRCPQVRYGPAFTVGYAFGSGGKNGFRQSGLHNNTAKIGGLTAVQYYGELFDPELNNMHIVTGGAAITPRADLSVELLAHSYFQTDASTTLLSSGITASPAGLKCHLGEECDLILGFRRGQFSLIAEGSLFFPGDAFTYRDMACQGIVKGKYNF